MNSMTSSQYLNPKEHIYSNAVLNHRNVLDPLNKSVIFRRCHWLDMSSEGSNTASIHLGYAHIVSEDVDILMFLLIHWHPQSCYVHLWCQMRIWTSFRVKTNRRLRQKHSSSHKTMFVHSSLGRNPFRQYKKAVLSETRPQWRKWLVLMIREGNSFLIICIMNMPQGSSASFHMRLWILAL